MQRARYLRPAGATLLALIVLLAACTEDEAPGSFDWREDWSVLPGYTVTQDTLGYSYPAALAFVPNPGSAPGDALYFVAELRGTIKAVTNDRSVHTFASVTAYQPGRELPAVQGESGLAGLCLDGARGYVFATFVYSDESGLLRNDIVRFSSAPGVFGLRPTETREIGGFLAQEQTSVSHQIGGCEVAGDALYVGVGDGEEPASAQALDRLLGKVLRLTLDGEPHPENPFYDHASMGLPPEARYVYAHGFRNPFGIQVVDGQVFVDGNGPSVDRFVRVKAGEDHLWDGSDWSIGASADVIFSPAVSPVQSAYYPRGSTLFPLGHRDRFYIAASGGAGSAERSGIIAIDYDFGEDRVASAPSYFARYRGERAPNVVATAFGPDGLYFAGILPNEAGETAVLRISHDPEADYPYTSGRQGGLIAAKGCQACHLIDGDGGAVGPRLDFTAEQLGQLETRLTSDEYLAQLAELDASDEPALVANRERRNEMREAESGTKARTWIRNRLLDPRFDDTQAQMPKLGLSEDEANEITKELLTPAGGASGPLGRVQGAGRAIRDALPFLPAGRAGDVISGGILGAGAGLLGGVALTAALAQLMRGRRSSRAARAGR